MSDNNILLEVQGLKKAFGDNKVLDGITTDIRQGEVVAVIGPSGSGKSTFLRSLNLLEVPTGGRILFEGTDITDPKVDINRHRQKIGMVFQQFNLFPNMTVKENIMLAPVKLKLMSQSEASKKADELLTRVGLPEKADTYPDMLSGGQKQRIAIARALATEPKVILCDEATSALDPNTTKSILALLKDLNRKMGITVVVITHEMDVISSICDNVAIIDKGDIVERGPVKEIFESPKSHIGKQLIMGDAIKETDFSGGRYFRITFDGREAGEPVISNLVLRTKVPVNIMYAQTKAIGNKAVGEMVIQFSENEENVDSALNYLKTVNIPFEEVTENDF